MRLSNKNNKNNEDKYFLERQHQHEKTTAMISNNIPLFLISKLWLDVDESSY